MSARNRVTTRTLLAYGGPVLGISSLLFFVQFYFLKFATDVLLLPPVAVGVLFAMAKFWDAASNPFVGSWSDRTRSRFGRRRPFLIGSLPLLVIGFVMLWSPPASLSTSGLIVWSGVALFIFFASFALYTIPHAALGAELSTDSHERTRLFGARQISFTAGILLAFGAIQLAMNAASPREATARMAIPAALVAVALLSLTPLLVRERGGAKSSAQSLFADLRDLMAKPATRTLLLVWFIESLGVGSVGTMAPYIAEYLLGRPDIVGTLPAAYVLSGIVSIPIWVRVSRAFGTRDTWLGTMLLAAVAFGGMVFVGRGDIILIVTLLVIAGSAMGCGTVLSSSIMADLIDLDEQQSGERKEGIYSASMNFAFKIGNSLATAASGIVLGMTGFVPNVEQSAESLLGIRILFAGFPCLGFLVGAALFRKFPYSGRRAAPVVVEPVKEPAVGG